MSIIRNSGVSAVERGLNILKSMEIQSGHSELSVISQVSAVEGCPLSRVPLYVFFNELSVKKERKLSSVALQRLSI